MVRETVTKLETNILNENKVICEDYLTLVLPKGEKQISNRISNGMDFIVKRVVIYSNPIMQIVLDGEIIITTPGVNYEARFDGRSLKYEPDFKRFTHNIGYPFALKTGRQYGIITNEYQRYNLNFTLMGISIRNI